MNLEHANFWVRPFQFRGDGSSGAAHAFARIEIGGKEREFWLKVVENRLFFAKRIAVRIGRSGVWIVWKPSTKGNWCAR
jgi:hypothetical protein